MSLMRNCSSACIRPTDFFEENIVQFMSEERMVLPVDNMHGGSSEVNQVLQSS